jgi:hypothetical protein
VLAPADIVILTPDVCEALLGMDDRWRLGVLLYVFWGRGMHVVCTFVHVHSTGTCCLNRCRYLAVDQVVQGEWFAAAVQATAHAVQQATLPQR